MRNSAVMRNTSTITLQKGTIKRLGDIGRFGESYEDIVVKILDQVANKDPGGRNAR
jgi:hypothetical protein